MRFFFGFVRVTGRQKLGIVTLVGVHDWLSYRLFSAYRADFQRLLNTEV